MKPYRFFRLPLLFLLACCFTADLSAQPENEKYAAEMGLADAKYSYFSDAPFYVEYQDGHVFRGPYLPLRAVGITERYLPLTTSAPAAITAYREALEHAANVRLDQYFEKMEAAVKIDPNFFMGYAHQAMAQVSFGEYEKAAKLIDQALAICSDDHTRAEQILCKLMAQWKADPKSSPEPLMEELVVVYPKTAEAYELAASCAVWIDKDHQQALNYYQAAQRLRPDYGPGYNMLGYAYLRTDQPAKAKQAFESYLRLSPDEANAYDSMGEYYLTMEDYAKSVEYYEQAVAKGMSSAKERAAQAREALAKKGK